MVNVLDKGEITLIDSMGGDISVVAAARVSNAVTYEEASRGEEKDAKLIKFLARNRHGTPFEHATFTFRVKAPLFVVREWQRHRMGSYNEVSGRYVEFNPEFYYPNLWRVPGKTNKQGSAVPMPFDQGWQDEAHLSYADAMQEAYARYVFLIEHGVAKEMARMLLPLSLYTEFYWTVNARSLMNFISLRSAEDAQWEIRQYGIALKRLFRERMPLTYAAFEENGFIAP